jgi:hypothetical protein
MGDLIIRWTIRLALVGYAGRYAVDFAASPSARNQRWSLVAWTWGAVWLGIHTIAAMGIAHGWSHAAAVEHTARRSAELTGTPFGAGAWLNYACLMVWAIDAAWWGLAPASFSKRPVWIAALIHGYLAFIVVNACIVFESGPTRWVSVAVAAVLIALAVRRLITERRVSSRRVP